MLKTLTLKDRQNGELEIRRMSEKAQFFYNNSEPITVAKLSNDTMSIRGAYGNYDNISIKECEEIFENLFYTLEGFENIYDHYMDDETKLHELMNGSAAVPDGITE